MIKKKKTVKMLYRLGLISTGVWLYFGCILVVFWSQYNVVTTVFGVYIFTLSQRKFTTLSQPKHNVVATLSQRCIICWEDRVILSILLVPS